MSGDKPLLVGITGGIGAGKSIISKVFGILGTPCYDADSRARWLMNHLPEIRQVVLHLFGEESYLNGELNRPHLAKLAFHDNSLLTQLNAVVHPAVAKDFEMWAISQKTLYVLKEAALLFETGSYKQLDEIIFVGAEEATRIARVKVRDPQRTEQDIKAIIEKQWPESQKANLANYIITNDESRLVIPQVVAIHQKLLEKSTR